VGAVQYIFGGVLLFFALFLIIAVLLQQGKSHHLSGSIAGGAETFFGKERGKTIDRIMSKLTSAVAVLFVLAVLVLYVIQS
jgi:preprotein translocase subunit SecG